ncbi:MAG TPA: hypothetical protein PK771_16410, partial [Spirochaetota bacterium]|nr:hypothetical protein [Spirochaetota bacterium]
IFCGCRETKPKLDFICLECYETFLKQIEEQTICKICGHPLKENQICPSCPKLGNIYYDDYHFIQYYRDFFKSTAIMWKKNENYLITKLFYNLLSDKKILNDKIPITVVPDNLFKRFKKGRSSLHYLLKLLEKSKYSIVNNIYYKRLFLLKNQKSKTENERFDDISKTFYLPEKNKNKYSGEIYLIDDIYTTGATLNHGAKLLKDAGFNKVHIVSFFRAVLE